MKCFIVNCECSANFRFVVFSQFGGKKEKQQKQKMKIYIYIRTPDAEAY